MENSDYSTSDELYRQGLQHFRQGEWRAAIAAFTTLDASGGQHPGVERLLADARFKLKLDGVEAPPPMAAPRGPILLRALLIVAIGLVLVAGYEVALLIKSAPPAVAAVARVIPTPIPATATPQQASVVTVTAAATAPAPSVQDATAGPAAPGTLVIAPADDGTLVSTPANVEIVVDASGSMYSRVAGTNKQRWQVAQDALKSLISSGTVSPQSAVSLRTYGRRRGGDCRDLEVVQPLKLFKADELSNAVNSIKPAVGGMTPLGASIHAAAGDLQAVEGSTALIVVTDGIESCNGDPVGEAAGFVKDSPQRKVHVIGFAVDNKAESDKLRQIAAAGNGLYFDAGSTAQLASALRQTLVLGYQVTTADGVEVAKGNVGQGGPVQLQPGSYKLKINANPPFERDFAIDNGGHVQVRIRQGYGGLIADVKTGAP